jgi:hypothetical protein
MYIRKVRACSPATMWRNEKPCVYIQEPILG